MSSPTVIHRCFIFIRWKVSCPFVSRKELLLWPSGAVFQLASLVNMWVKFLSRNYTSFQNLHQIPILSSIYWGLQFVCLYLVSLFDFISAKKLRHANYNEIPARSTCHVSLERAVLDLIALRKHDTVITSDLCKKNFISNLYVIGMPLNEQTISFFFLTMQFYRS